MIAFVSPRFVFLTFHFLSSFLISWSFLFEFWVNALSLSSAPPNSVFHHILFLRPIFHWCFHFGSQIFQLQSVFPKLGFFPPLLSAHSSIMMAFLKKIFIVNMNQKLYIVNPLQIVPVDLFLSCSLFSYVQWFFCLLILRNKDLLANIMINISRGLNQPAFLIRLFTL